MFFLTDQKFTTYCAHKLVLVCIIRYHASYDKCKEKTNLHQFLDFRHRAALQWNILNNPKANKDSMSLISYSMVSSMIQIKNRNEEFIYCLYKLINVPFYNYDCHFSTYIFD